MNCPFTQYVCIARNSYYFPLLSFSPLIRWARLGCLLVFMIIWYVFHTIYLGDVMVSIKNSSICIDCGSNGCLALIRALPSAELYSVNSSQCVDFKRSEGSGSYSVAVFAIGYDGAIMNRPIVNQQINLYSKSESRNGTPTRMHNRRVWCISCHSPNSKFEYGDGGRAITIPIHRYNFTS